MIVWKDQNAEESRLKADNWHKMMPDIIDYSGGNFLTRKSGYTNRLEIAANTKIGINNGGTFKVFDVGASAKQLVEGDLDTGVFAVGVDYYVYLHDDGVDAEVYIISMNSTYPSSHGCTAANTRKIGGFHYCYQRNSITPADVTVAIMAASVWDLRHRPKCSPEGMIYGAGGKWGDIYLPSQGEVITITNGVLLAGTALSKYGVTPLTGAEGLNGFNFVELARRSGKYVMSFADYLMFAHGHPAGDQFAGNTSTRGTTGQDVALGAISFAGMVDATRKLYQWLDEYTIRQDTTLWAWQNPMSGQNVGQLYLPDAAGISQFMVGGRWDDGALAGSRSVDLSFYPWAVTTIIGSRFACDAL